MTDALSYFTAKLEHETDASDVYAAQRGGESFVLVDVRSDEAWAQGHAVGAIHLPHQEITARAAAELLAGPLGWSPEQVAQEVSTYLERVAAERAAEVEPDDASAERARLRAPDIRPLPLASRA